MGAYIEIMSNHNLDLTDMSSLARVIAHKFKVNIKITTYLSEQYHELRYGKKNWEKRVLEEIVLNPEWVTLELEDNKFEQIELLRMEANQELKLPDDYKKYAEEAIQENEIVLNWPKDHESYMCHMYFYDQVVFLSTDYYMKWYQFVDLFACNSYMDIEIERGEILKMRKALQKHSSLLGANHVYMMNDDYQYWTEETEDIKDDWKRLEKAVDQYDHVIYLSKYFSDNEYRKVVDDTYWWQPIFKDDFRDLLT